MNSATPASFPEEIRYEAGQLYALLEFTSRLINPERLPPLVWTEVARRVEELVFALGVDVRAPHATLEAVSHNARTHMAGQLQQLRQELRAYAKANEIRIFLFGSMLRGDFGLMSDVDIAFDAGGGDRSQKPIADDLKAMCWRRGLKPDVIAVNWFGREGLERLLASAVEV